MRYAKNAEWHVLLWLLTCLFVTSCATTPLPSPPEVTKEATVQPLSSELKKPPEPSGAYWSRVTQWRKVWRETLKTLQAK